MIARSAILASCVVVLPRSALACEEPTDVADITATLDRIDASYRSADTVAYSDAMSNLGPTLDCVAEVLPRSTIARVHRAQGLAAFTQQDGERLQHAFAAAKALDPEYVFPDSFVPASHPLARMYADVEPSDLTTPLPPPPEGFFLIDGDAADVRPLQRSTVLQHIVGRNEVALTRYLRPHDRGWALLDTPAPEAPVGMSPRPFWVASIAAAGLGAAVYGIAATRRSAYDNADPVDKPALRSQTHQLVTASVGLAGVAAGSAAIGLVVRR